MAISLDVSIVNNTIFGLMRIRGDYLIYHPVTEVKWANYFQNPSSHLASDYAKIIEIELHLSSNFGGRFYNLEICDI